MAGIYFDRIRKVKDQATKAYVETIAANEREDRQLRRNLDVIGGQQRKQRLQMQRLIKAAKIQQEKQLKRIKSVICYANRGDHWEGKNMALSGIENAAKTRRLMNRPVEDTRKLQRYKNGMRTSVDELRRCKAEFASQLQMPLHTKQKDKTLTWKSAAEMDDSVVSKDSCTLQEEKMQVEQSKTNNYCKVWHRKGGTRNPVSDRKGSDALGDTVKYTETEVKNLKVSFVRNRGQDSKKRRHVSLPDLDEDPKIVMERRRRKWKRLMLKKIKEQQQRSILEEKLKELSLREITSSERIIVKNQQYKD